jgi:hypothetical protein
MIDLTRKRPLLGDTVAEFIETRPYEIDGDGEGLWGIVPHGRNFGFEGGELSEFVRLCILRLLKAGAVPVRHTKSGTVLWEEQKQYGSSHEEIADAIIAEWLANGGGNPPWEYLWFVTREVLETAKRLVKRGTPRAAD